MVRRGSLGPAQVCFEAWLPATLSGPESPFKYKGFPGLAIGDALEP